MNELKIQVESKDDINYVVQNLKAFAFQKLESRLAANDQQDLLEACRSTMEEASQRCLFQGLVKDHDDSCMMYDAYPSPYLYIYIYMCMNSLEIGCHYW